MSFQCTSGAETYHRSGAHEFILDFVSGVRVTRFLVLYVCFVDRCLSFCIFFLFAIVLSVLLLYTDHDYTFGIFKLFFQTFFYLTYTYYHDFSNCQIVTMHALFRLSVRCKDR